MKSVIITIDDSQLGQMTSILDSFAKCGLEVTNHFDFGVITGNADEEAISKIKSHSEVISLEEDRPVKIAPSGSKIQ